MNRDALLKAGIILLLVLGRAVWALEESRTPGGVKELFQQAAGTFPPGAWIPPDEFYNHQAAKRLVEIARVDVDALLAEGRFRECMIVLNPPTFEQFKARPVLDGWHSDAPRGALSLREEYDRYMERLWDHEKRRCELEHKRQVIRMVLKKVASDEPNTVVDLLNREDCAVRQVGVYLARDLALKEENIVRALLACLPAKDPGKEVLAGMSTEQVRARELSIEAARVLSAWQVEEAWSYVERLSRDPFYHYRSYSLQMANRYGFRRAIPLSISLLGDETGVVRGSAFVNLFRMTGVTLGRSCGFWYDEAVSPQSRTEAADKWRAWWHEQKAKDDATFHVAVIKRAFDLMDEYGPFGPRDALPTSPYDVLSVHVDISGISSRGRKEAELAAELKKFWEGNRARMRFDVDRHKFVLEQAQ